MELSQRPFEAKTLVAAGLDCRIWVLAVAVDVVVEAEFEAEAGQEEGDVRLETEHTDDLVMRQ